MFITENSGHHDQERASTRYGGWAEPKLTQPASSRIIDQDTYDLPGSKKWVAAYPIG